MPKIANQNRAIMLAVTTALATTALGGCTAKVAAPADFSASKAQAAIMKGKTNKAVVHAEEAVLAQPRNSAYRAMLGAVYMEAGRFQSAATSFKDAMALGDNSPRTALSYALAEIATGNTAVARAVLDDWRDQINPADLGLAFALAGDPAQGVHVLGNAVRTGQNTAKVRQNLAYAYALKGDWRSARLMAAEDVPANEINDRIAEWAATAAPAQNHARVANLLGVPFTGDTGQPAMLALSNHSSTEQLAAEASGLVPAPAAPAVAQAPVAPAPVAVAAAPTYELPPIGGELPAVQERPAEAVAAYAASPVAKPKDFADAFSADAPSGASLAQVTESAVKFVSNPVVQKAPARFGAEAKPTPRAEARAAAKAQGRDALAGEHLIQLGSFSSEAGARRAWGIYAKQYPQLGQYDMVITKAVVRGKTYYRVSAGGFQRASAESMCSAVKSGKQGCITWAANRPLPGAVDRGVRMAAR